MAASIAVATLSPGGDNQATVEFNLNDNDGRVRASDFVAGPTRILDAGAMTASLFVEATVGTEFLGVNLGEFSSRLPSPLS